MNVLKKIQESTKPFSFPIEKKVTSIDKDVNESVVTISYRIRFIESARFMACSLSNRVDNLAEEIHKSKRKYCYCFLEYESVKDNLIRYKCLSCNKDIPKSLMEN